MITAIVVTVILGAVAGWIASIIMDRNNQQGGVMNIVVGIVGAFVGGVLSALLGGEKGADLWIELTLADVFWSVVGACLLLAIVNYRERGKVR